MTIPDLGAACLGIVIGWLARYFLTRFRSFTPKIMASVVSILVGGAAVEFLSMGTGGGPNTVWFYPIGLLVGFVVYTIVAVIAIRHEEAVAKPSGKIGKANKSNPAASGGGPGGGFVPGQGPYKGPVYAPPAPGGPVTPRPHLD